MNITVDQREFDTVLAALRYWQREGLMSSGMEQEIASNGRDGDKAALSADEIDALIERINEPATEDDLLGCVSPGFFSPGFDPAEASDEACENEIIARLVTDAIAKGYMVSVNDGGEWVLSFCTELAPVLAAIRSTSEDRLMFRDARKRPIGSVLLIYGNEPWAVIADASANDAMCELMAGADCASKVIELARATA